MPDQSQKMVVNVASQVAETALGASGATPHLSQTALAALGVGTQVGVLLPFSRTHESEADYIGILLAAEAGYDPRESIHLWERMEQASSGKSQLEFLSTHPGHGTRIKQLEKWMEEPCLFIKPNHRHRTMSYHRFARVERRCLCSGHKLFETGVHDQLVE